MRLLAVALLSCSMLAAKPALAQQQVESDQLNLNVITDTNVVIDSSSFSQMNTVSTTIINSSTVSADDFTQSAKISQTNAIAIEATNSDSTNTGVNAQITNNTFDQTNDATTSITNNASISANKFTQSIQLNQINALSIEAANSGSIKAMTGINAQIDNNVFTQENTGDTSITNNGNVFGHNFTQSIQLSQINALTIDIGNSGSVKASDIGINAEIQNNTFSQTNGEPTTFDTNTNTGAITTDSFTQSIQANQINLLGAVTIANSGSINAGNIGINAVFNNNTFNQSNVINNTNDNSGTGTIPTQVIDVNQINVAVLAVQITNSGSVFGGNIGINTDSDAGTFILNSGSISAGSGLAIKTSGLGSIITNASGGLITGFVELTDDADQFFNQKGGTFEARQTSDFGDGNDLFVNEGVLHADPITQFINLEEFDNSGLISMVNGNPHDVFEIAQVLGSTGLDFVASKQSTLGIDAELGPPGSTADHFVVDGTVTGKTKLEVNDTLVTGGAPNKVGIPVVFVNTPVTGKEFYLPQPVDAGLFQYDLFFEPGAVNIWDLKGALGPGAFVLPQLTTGLQDIWHTTSDSWFDRTADLRVALYGRNGLPATQVGPGTGASYVAPPDSPSYVAPVAGYAGTGIPAPYPGLWARISLAGLDREDAMHFQSFGPTTANLDRNQLVGDSEVGIDFGARDLLYAGDALIFGVLGGYVVSNLDYDKIERNFDIQGGQVGAYATYLNGGLFVDTLVKDDILNIDSDISYGTPGSLSANNIGVRTDAGYRFGALAGGGFFYEPLATVAWVNSEIDDFTRGANRVNFEDGNSVRGRLGLRLGTSYNVAQMTIEPFVIASVWHEFEDQNRALLTTTGAVTFSLADSLNDTWGEVSGGVNIFNVDARASGFAKVDAALGDNYSSVGGQVGLRVNW